MFNRQNIIALFLLLLFFSGCAENKTAYVMTGGVIGAGAGYAIDEDVKDAAIGGMLGGISAAVIADIHQNHETVLMNKSFDQGYTQAQLAIAIQNWDINTGRRCEHNYLKSYRRIKIPKQEFNNVIYDEHYETLEAYK